MIFKSPIRNLALLLLLILFTAYAPFASADPNSVINETTENCAGKLLPQALNLEKVRPDSFTAHADHFMKALWPAMSLGKNVLEVQSSYFTTFVSQHLPELVRNHSRNRVYAHEDFAGSNEGQLQILEKYLNYADTYISQLQKRITNGEQLNYLDVLRFSLFLVLTSEPEADRKLIALYDLNDDAAIQRRYPGKKHSDLDFYIKYITTVDYKRKFWQQTYGVTFKSNLQTKDQIEVLSINPITPSEIQLSHLKRILIIPTKAPAGPAAFYLNFHLPINPLALPSEYELLDNVSLASPLTNFSHDVGHYINLLIRHHIEQLHAIQADLKSIREIVISKNDPKLLKMLYYVAYFIRFESQLPIPLNSEQLVEQLQYLANYNTNFHIGSRSEPFKASEAIHTLFRNSLNSTFAPAKNELEFGLKLAEIIALISIYNIQKSNLSMPEQWIKRIKLWEQHLKNLHYSFAHERAYRRTTKKQ